MPDIRLAKYDELMVVKESFMGERYARLRSAANAVFLDIASKATFDIICDSKINSYGSFGEKIYVEYQSNGSEVILRGNVTHLKCPHNSITELNILSLKGLTELDCSSNQLPELGVPDSKDLVWLGCDRNQLTMLDVSKLTGLINLSCARNPNLNELLLPTFKTPINDSSGFMYLYIDDTLIGSNPDYIINNIIPKLPTRSNEYRGTIGVTNTATANAIQPYLTPKFWTAQ